MLFETIAETMKGNDSIFLAFAVRTIVLIVQRRKTDAAVATFHSMFALKRTTHSIIFVIRQTTIEDLVSEPML